MKRQYTFGSELKATFSVRVSGDGRIDAMRGFWNKDLGNKIQRLLEDSGLFETVMVESPAPLRVEKVESESAL